ncbi:abortive infection protein [Lachnospiraceae bacterium KM106-2]|nr:abortive infection protein [Lachnospiraceae bacterium KM106-2]
MEKAHSDQNIRIVIQAIIFTFIGMILISNIINLLSRSGVTIFRNSAISNILLELTILAVQLMILRRYYKRAIIKELGLTIKEMSWSRITLFFAVGTGIVALSFVILMAVSIVHYEGTGFRLIGSKETFQLLFSRLVQMLVVAIAEETCFRGVIANHLDKRSGKTVAILGSTMIFTVFHCMVWQTVTQITDIFVLGLILGILFMRSGSLYDAIIFHFAIDFVTNLFGMEAGEGVIILSLGNGYREADITMYLFGVMTVLGVVACIALSLIRDRK